MDREELGALLEQYSEELAEKTDEHTQYIAKSLKILAEQLYTRQVS